MLSPLTLALPKKENMKHLGAAIILGPAQVGSQISMLRPYYLNESVEVLSSHVWPASHERKYGVAFILGEKETDFEDLKRVP